MSIFEGRVLLDLQNHTHRLIVSICLSSLVTNFAVLYGVINAFAALYFCGFHQGGIGQATEFVNIQAVKVKNPRIWVMMQCYTFPVYT